MQHHNIKIRHSVFVAGAAALLTLGMFLAEAQTPAPTLEKQLESQYPITTPTADNTALVTTGAVLVLQKRGLSAGLASNRVPTQNYFKDGDPQIKGGAAAAVRKISHFGIPGIPGVPGMGTASTAAGDSRDFVNGEKVYVTRIDIDHAHDAIIFYLISDAYDAGRYTASLKIELAKGTLAKNDLAPIQKVIDQVLKVAPADNVTSNQTAPQGQAAPSQAAPAAPVATTQTPAQPDPTLPAIAPPPPPPPDPAPPKSIGVGQTPDEVTAILGPPKNIVDLGAKKIYIYPDIKVTFVSGKMTTAE